MIGKQIEQNTRNGGSPVWCVTGLLWEGLVRLGLVMWRFCGAFLRHFGCLGAPFGVILAVLERFWASFWVSWALLARPFGPSWPKIAKKGRFFDFDFRMWDPSWEPKLRKIDIKNDVFFRWVFDIVFYRFFIDFGFQISTFFGSILDVKAKTPIL